MVRDDVTLVGGQLVIHLQRRLILVSKSVELSMRS